MIKEKEIIADMHVHTIASQHALSTLHENIEVAKKRNLKYIAITDHYWNDGTVTYRCNDMTRAIIVDSHYNCWHTSKNDVNTINGLELNIGQIIDEKDLIQDEIKWRTLGLHTWHYDVVSSTLYELLDEFKELANYVKCFVHIERKLDMLNNGKYEHTADDKGLIRFFNEICKLAIENNIYLEVNESSLREYGEDQKQKMYTWLKIAKEQGVNISLGSDAHYCDAVGVFKGSIKLLNDIDYPRNNILNLDKERIKDELNLLV